MCISIIVREALRLNAILLNMFYLLLFAIVCLFGRKSVSFNFLSYFNVSLLKPLSVEAISDRITMQYVRESELLILWSMS